MLLWTWCSMRGLRQATTDMLVFHNAMLLPTAWLMHQADPTGTGNKPWKLPWKQITIPRWLSDKMNVYIRQHNQRYKSLWEHQSLRTTKCFFWPFLRASASPLVKCPYLPHFMQGRRGEAEPTLSSLLSSHGSFHVLFSFKLLPDEIKTWMLVFSEIFVTHNRESIDCRLKQTKNNNKNFFFSRKHDSEMHWGCPSVTQLEHQY